MTDVVHDDLGEDEQLDELLAIQNEREQRDLAEARERIEQRRAQEVAEAAIQAEAQRQQAEHVAAVIAAHTSLSNLGHVADEIDATLAGLIDAYVRYQGVLMTTVPLLEKAGRDGAALEQTLTAQMICTFRDALSTSGMPPGLRQLAPGRMSGAVVAPLFSHIDVVLRDLFADLTLVGPQEVSQP